MQTIRSYLVKISVNVVNYCTIITWYKIVIDNCFFVIDKVPWEITQRVEMTEFMFLHSAPRCMLVDTCIKFREYSLSGFQVIERTLFL